MMQDKISIIIPAYNAAKFIRETVDSVLCQTYRNWELILVNDGSKDDTGAEIDTIASTDERIMAVHQENGGEVAARRKGVLHASGQWVMFLDADDYLPSDSIYSLYKYVSADIDIVCGTMHVQNIADDGAVKEDYIWQNVRIGELSETEFARGIFEMKVQMAAWGKLYRRSVFDKFEWCFDRKIRQNPDLLMNIGLGSCIRKAFVTNEAICYNYIIRSGSASTSGIMPYDSWKRLFVQASVYLSSYPAPNLLTGSFTHYRLGCFDAMMRHKITKFPKNDDQIEEVIENSKTLDLSLDEKKVIKLLKYPFLRKVFAFWQNLKCK